MRGTKGTALVKNRILSLQSELLQHAGLLMTFVLLVAAKDFALTRPSLAAGLVFVFCVSYLVAAIATKRAHFLYSTMLLGAVAYFMACASLGAPGSWFPALSLPLVATLWLIGQWLAMLPSAARAAFSRTTYRAMNITVAVFTVWAVWQAPALLAETGPVRYVPGLAFLGFALLYLAHILAGAAAGYVYVFCTFLLVAAGLIGSTLVTKDYSWPWMLASAGVMAVVGTSLHRTKGSRWARHIYFCFGGALLVSFTYSLLAWRLILLELALSSLLLWAAYCLLSRAIGDVKRATSNERLTAKYFFLGAQALSAPVCIFVFVWPADLYVAFAALVCGLMFAWMAWARSDERFGNRNHYVLASALFMAPALGAIAASLSSDFASAIAMAVSLILMVVLSALHSFWKAENRVSWRRAAAEAMVFPGLFIWYLPLCLGNAGLALSGAIAALVLSQALAGMRKEQFFLCGSGAGAAGIICSAAVLFSSQNIPFWTLSCAGAIVAAGIYLRGSARGKAAVRESAHSCWLILSIAALVQAGESWATSLLALTVLSSLAVLIAGVRRKQDARADGLDQVVTLLCVLGTLGVVLLGFVPAIGSAFAGQCILVLAFAYVLSWTIGRGLSHGRLAAVLFALGTSTVVFGMDMPAEARLFAELPSVAILFAVGVLTKKRFEPLSRSSVAVGHVTASFLAIATLFYAWSSSPPALAYAALCYAVIYAFMPRLRATMGFRLGCLCWLSLALWLGLAAYRDSLYSELVLTMTGLALLWLALGFGLRRGRNAVWTMPLFIAATLVVLCCGAVNLFAPVGEDTWRVFLVGGLVFASLFLILRKDIYQYLVTLALILMAFDWVRVSTSQFTQDVLFYIVIAAGLLGAVFALPYMKKLGNRLAAIPIFSLFTWQGAVFVIVPLFGVAMVVSSVYSVKITGHPKFCMSCHYMGDYYDSWQHSSHAEVACVECHYEPGAEAIVVGKLDGMIQLVKYVSHAYDNKPHAEISNVSCMRSGCHADMDQSQEALLFRDRIRFRHDQHLSEQPRGKVLNCVSCHGQAVKGQHISVTESTCVTCHFYGRGERPVAMGDCETCHVLPEEHGVAGGTLAFDHQGFLEGNEKARCEQCHSQVTQGDGAVSRTRCFSCHLAVPEKIEDQAEFHLVHVTSGHFDCQQCHDEIKHGTRPIEQQLLASGNCELCHRGDRHTIQEAIYSGTELAGVEGMPDFMYSAGVACDGCHTDLLNGSGSTFTKKHSGAKQCSECHAEESYGEMLGFWHEETKARVDDLKSILAGLGGQDITSKSTDGEAKKVQALLDASQQKLDYIVSDGSYGAHNYFYISSILDSAQSDLDECSALIQKAKADGRKES